jgi:simple sugar transport system ATP-binding protein
MTEPLIRVEHVSKSFGRVIALRDVSLSVHSGQVTCLLGDNGAGKSTLIQILAGVHRPTEGRYLVDGEAVGFNSPREALARGIATVYQDLALIPLLSVWRNFFLGAEPCRGSGILRRIDVGYCERVARQELEQLGVPLRDSSQTVATLSGGERQAVAIARALHFGARVLILDEPTAALGVKQATAVLGCIASARDRGVGVVFVTHNPRHAHPVGDRFVVLRRGEVLADCARSDIGVQQLADMMAGGDASTSRPLEQLR